MKKRLRRTGLGEKIREVISELGVVLNSSVNRENFYLGIFNLIGLSYNFFFFADYLFIKTELDFCLNHTVIS